MFTEHYRQPMSELSVLAYAEDLSDLTPDQLDAACIEARRTSEFMPVSATIRNCHLKIRSSEPVLLGPPQLTYPEISQEEREEALKYSAALRAALAKSPPSQTQRQKRKPLAFPPSQFTIEEQRAVLKRKGYL